MDRMSTPLKLLMNYMKISVAPFLHLWHSLSSPENLIHTKMKREQHQTGFSNGMMALSLALLLTLLALLAL